MENVEQNLAGALLATSVPKDLIDHYSDEYSLMNILTANYSSSMSATLLTEVLEEHGVRRQFSANESAFFDFAADGTSSNRWGEDPSSSGEASVRAAMVALTPGAHVFVTQRMPFVRDVLRMFAPDCTAPNITHHGIVHHVPKSPDEPCIVHFWRQGSDPVPSVALCSFRKFLNAESKGSAAGGGAGLDDDTVRRRVRRFGVMFYGVAPSSRLPGQAPRSRLYQRRTLPPAQIVANAESALRGGASGFSLGNTCEHLAVQCTLGPAHHASAQLESVFKAVQSLRDGLHRSGVGGRCSASDELASVARASLGSVRDVVAGSAERVGLDPIRLLLRTILDLLHVVGAPEHDVAEGRSAVDSIALALRAQAWHLALLMSPKRLAGDALREGVRDRAAPLARDACALDFELGTWSQMRLWTLPEVQDGARRQLQMWCHAPAGILPGATRWTQEVCALSLPASSSTSEKRGGGGGGGGAIDILAGDCVRFNGVRARVEVERIVAVNKEADGDAGVASASSSAAAPSAAAAAAAAPCSFKIRVIVECEGGVDTTRLSSETLCRRLLEQQNASLRADLCCHTNLAFDAAHIERRRAALDALWRSAAPPEQGPLHAVLHPRDIARAFVEEVGDGDTVDESTETTPRGELAQSLLESFVWRTAHAEGALASRFTLPVQLPAEEQLETCTYEEPCGYDPSTGVVQALVLSAVTLRVKSVVDRDGELTHRLVLGGGEEEGKEAEGGTIGSTTGSSAAAPARTPLIILDGWRCDPTQIKFTARGGLKTVTRLLKRVAPKNPINDKVRRVTATKIESALRKVDRMLRPQLLKAIGAANGVAAASGLWRRLAEPFVVAAPEVVVGEKQEEAVTLRLLPRALDLVGANSGLSERAEDADAARMLLGAEEGGALGTDRDPLRVRVRTAVGGALSKTTKLSGARRAVLANQVAKSTVTEVRGYSLDTMQRAYSLTCSLIELAERSLEDVKRAWSTRQTTAELEALRKSVETEAAVRTRLEAEASQLQRELREETVARREETEARRQCEEETAAAQLRHAGELLAKDRAADERCRAMSDAFARQNLALRKEHNATLEKMQRS